MAWIWKDEGILGELETRSHGLPSTMDPEPMLDHNHTEARKSEALKPDIAKFDRLALGDHQRNPYYLINAMERHVDRERIHTTKDAAIAQVKQV